MVNMMARRTNNLREDGANQLPDVALNHPITTFVNA